MKSSTTDVRQLRKYLLGEIAQANEVDSIEKRMLSDGVFLAELERVEAELIEEYIDEMLSSEEKKNFEKRFLAAPERKEKFRFMAALDENAAKYKAGKGKRAVAGAGAKTKKEGSFSLHRFFSGAGLRFAAFAVVILAVSAGAWWYLTSTNKVNEGLADLRVAFLKQRPTEARFTPLDYAPPSNIRGTGPEQIDTIALDKAGLRLMEATKEQPGVDSYRALGVYYATRQEYVKALDQFGKGEAFNPADPKFYADFGAATLETAKAGRNGSAEVRLRYLDGSLSHLNKALELDRDNLPALFNKALCLQEMGPPAAAREAWQKYLEKDPSSKWAGEARDRLKLLEENSTGAKTAPDVLREFLEAYDSGDNAKAWKIAAESKEMITGTMVSEQLTRALLSPGAQGVPEGSQRMLSALSFLGRLEKQNAGDDFFLELAGYYGKIDPRQREKLNRAQALTMEGYLLCKDNKILDALPKFEESRKLFAAAGNQWEAAKTDYWISYCLAEKDREKSLKLSQTTANYARLKNYKWLLGQVLIQSSSTHTRLSNYSSAIAAAGDALVITREISDTYNFQKTSAQNANNYVLLNEPSRALENSQASLRERGTFFNSPRQTWRNYMFASQVSSRFGLPESAVAYAREGVRISRETLGDPGTLNNSLLSLSNVYRFNKDYKNALAAAEESVTAVSMIIPGPTRERFLANSLLPKAEAERLAGDCGQAVSDYDQVIAIYSKQDYQAALENYYAMKGRLLCYGELGQDQNVAENLKAVLDLNETLRASIEEENFKTTFFADEQSVYEFAAEYALKNNNDIESAFDQIEKGKARSLLDVLNRPSESAPRNPMPVLSIPDIRQQLPAGTQLVQYGVLPDKLFIWVVSENNINFVEKKISGADLDTKVRKFMQYVSRPDADRAAMDRSSAELYDLLIQPILPFLDKEKPVSIVPDKALCFLPFEALRSPAGKYAIEDYQFSYAPSATLLVLLSERAKRQAAPAAEETFLGVGNPDFDRDDNPGLPDLLAAESEIGTSAALYKTNWKFNGKDAAKQKILAILPRADVFHFAGHYKANEISPNLSKFLLAKNNTADESGLTVAEVGGLKLSKTRLVILSACQTAIENYYRGEGAIGVARTFFAAGVATVVASRWEADSTAAADLMSAFHRYRKINGLSNSAALRAAQIDLLKNENKAFDSPYFWAAFAVIGGSEKA